MKYTADDVKRLIDSKYEKFKPGDKYSVHFNSELLFIIYDLLKRIEELESNRE